MPTAIDLNELRERISTLVDIASEREIPLYEVQSVFRSTADYSARNLEGLKNKLNGEFDSVKLSHLYNNIRTLVYSHIKYDDKLISIYKFESLEDINDLIKDLEALDFLGEVIDTNNMEKDYTPFIRDDSVENKCVYQFVVRRETTVRQQLNPEDLKDYIIDDYQEVYGVKRIPLTCYDSLTIDKNDRLIIISIDLARVLTRAGLNVAQNNFQNFLKKLLKINLNNPINLFPKIQCFYNEPKDKSNGVIEISFTTTDGTAHYEKLRGTALDLRLATYHEKGVEGVKNESKHGMLLNNDITPYRISSKFYRSQLDIDHSDIEIDLKSSYIAINTSNGSQLHDAFIYGCRNQNDFDFTVHKLI